MKLKPRDARVRTSPTTLTCLFAGGSLLSPSVWRAGARRWSGMRRALQEAMHALAVVDPKPRHAFRERVLVLGAEALGDVELVALLLGTGAEGESVLGLAATVLEAAGGVSGIVRIGAHGLSECRGVGLAKAARLLAALELGRRAAMPDLADVGETLGSFDAVVDWARPRLASLEHEEVWLLGLDARNALRTARRVAQGGAHGCAVLPRDILRPALRDGASAIILLHNHPSGDPSPSADDIVMTRALHSACDAVGIALLDHVIVARGGASSLFENDRIR